MTFGELKVGAFFYLVGEGLGWSQRRERWVKKAHGVAERARSHGYRKSNPDSTLELDIGCEVALEPVGGKTTWQVGNSKRTINAGYKRASEYGLRVIRKNRMKKKMGFDDE